MVINNESDLGKALNSKQDTIEIEGDLVNQVIKIKTTGTVAWVVAVCAIGVAFVLALFGREGTETNGSNLHPTDAIVAISCIGAVMILGISTIISAFLIAVAAGGVGALNTLRKYKIIDQSNGKLVLQRM